jgi:hypothetical protein
MLIAMLPILTLLSGCSTVSNIVNSIQSSNNTIAEVEGMGVTITNELTPALVVELKPINAQANTNYTVDLYDKGNFRDTTNITWNEPQINVSTILDAYFTLTGDEYSAYLTASNDPNWWKPIFSIKIQDVTATTLPNNNVGDPLTLTYPKGGEIWHVGDVVTIKWTWTSNSSIPKDTPILINIWSGTGGGAEQITGDEGVPNTGSYKWTVPNSVAGLQIIGTQDKIEMQCVNNPGTFIVSDAFSIVQ